MQTKVRNTLVTIFVILWAFLFHYESLRANYLSPFFHRPLPKFKFLFPPAGWIMFYRVDDMDVKAAVYGQKGDALELIDPHRIFNNHWLGYDNIRRNVLISALDPYSAARFCRYLKRKFPEYDYFAIAQVVYPSVTKYRDKNILKLAYRC